MPSSARTHAHHPRDAVNNPVEIKPPGFQLVLFLKRFPGRFENAFHKTAVA